MIFRGPLERCSGRYQTSNIGYIFHSGNNMWCPWWASNICTTGSTPLLMDAVYVLSMSDVTCNINVFSLDLVCNKHLLYIQSVIHLCIWGKKALSESYYYKTLHFVKTVIFSIKLWRKLTKIYPMTIISLDHKNEMQFFRNHLPCP